MGVFRIAQLGDLSRQLLFTPLEARSRQVLAAEELLVQIDPAKAYPYDFVLFRITGFHPKRPRHGDMAEDGFTGQLLTGLALQHDLGLLIESVSESLNVQVEGFGQPVLTIEDVCKQFNVSDKSIQRWRRRGLAGRRFIFPDGKNRIGFLAASVEQFFAAHRDRAARAANFTPVETDEQDWIIRSARRLALSGCDGEEIARRIGRRLHRSPLTITHAIGQHDVQNPQATILNLAAAPLSESDAEKIVAQYRRGMKLATLARRMHRPRAAIYRVLLENRLARLGRWKIRFVDDPLYHQPAADEVIEQIVAAAGAEQEVSTPQSEERRVPRDLPPYLQSLFQYPLLKTGEERALFLKLNFHKFEFDALRRKVESSSARWRQLDQLERHLQLAQETKNRIVAANLRLVVSVARKHMPAGSSMAKSGATLMDRISDGNVTLMRAADAFDVHRGNRFSTYVTLALMKEFARGRAIRASHDHGDVPLVMELPDPRGDRSWEEMARREQLQQLMAQLEDRERDVLRVHFGLADRAALETYEQVGQALGLSKERVRQIEQAALEKLRAGANEGKS